MERIRKGVGGEVTAEIFETWFPFMGYDDPVLFLMDFINSGNPTITIILKLEDGNFMLSNLNNEYARWLLQDLRGRDYEQYSEKGRGKNNSQPHKRYSV